MRRRPAGLMRLARADEGATLVEYAFVFPVLMLLVIGLMQLGGMAWAQAGLNFAVQQAARCMDVRPDVCGNPAQTESYAASQLPGLSPKKNVFKVQPAACGTQVSASMSYDFFAAPYGMPSARLTAQACEP